MVKKIRETINQETTQTETQTKTTVTVLPGVQIDIPDTGNHFDESNLLPNINNINNQTEDNSESNILYYIDLSTTDKPNNYIFYSDYTSIPESQRSFVLFLNITENNHAVYKYIPEEIRNPNVMSNLKKDIPEDVFEKGFNITGFLGLEQNYNFHLQEGVKLTESLSNGVVTISKVSGNIGKVFTALGTLGGYASAAASAFSTVRSILGLFIPGLAEPSIQDVLNVLAEMRAEFKASIEQLKEEIKQFLKDANASDYILHTKVFVEASAQLSDSYLTIYRDLLAKEGTYTFDEKSLLSHLYGNQNSYFNFLFKQLTDTASTDSIFNAIRLIVDQQYINSTVLSKPNKSYDATLVYKDDAVDWGAGSDPFKTLDFSIPDYFADTPGFDAAYVLKASTKVYLNFIETFIMVSKNLLDYYVYQELTGVSSPIYNQLRPQIETALKEIIKRLDIITDCWKTYYNASKRANELYALRVWRNVASQVGARSSKFIKFRSLVPRPGYGPISPNSLDSYLESKVRPFYNSSKYWSNAPQGYLAYRFSIRSDYKYNHPDLGFNGLLRNDLTSLRSALTFDWSNVKRGLSPIKANEWTCNYLSITHEIRAKVLSLIDSKKCENHIKELIDYDVTLSCIEKTRLSLINIISNWFEGDEYYPLLRRQNIDIINFSEDKNLQLFSYKQPNVFPTETNIITNSLMSTNDNIYLNNITLGIRYANPLGLSKDRIVWKNQEIKAIHTGNILDLIPKYNLTDLINSQAIPTAQIFLRSQNRIYLANQCDRDNNQTNFTSIPELISLLNIHPFFSHETNRDPLDVNSILASYPALLRKIDSKINYSLLKLTLNTFDTTEYVVRYPISIALGIRPVYRDNNAKNLFGDSLYLFGDIAWLCNNDNKAVLELNKGGKLHHKINFNGLPAMNFTNLSHEHDLIVCGFQIVYTYETDHKNTFTSPKIKYPIYNRGTGIGYECIEGQYDGSPIEITLGKTIWNS